MLVGGAIAVGVATRVQRTGELNGVDRRTSWRHAIAMAASVGVVVFAITALDQPHGYWIPMTMTLVLRPYGAETLAIARDRIAGTLAGAVLALIMVLLLPSWTAIVALIVLLVLLLAYAMLGRYAQEVLFLTPFIVLLGTGGVVADAAGLALQRILATLLGAVLAGGSRWPWPGRTVTTPMTPAGRPGLRTAQRPEQLTPPGADARRRDDQNGRQRARGLNCSHTQARASKP